MANGWRFRVDAEGRLVLQVLEFVADEPGYRGGWVSSGRQVWRDAAVTDIPVRDPFAVPPQAPIVERGE